MLRHTGTYRRGGTTVRRRRRGGTTVRRRHRRRVAATVECPVDRRPEAMVPDTGTAMAAPAAIGDSAIPWRGATGGATEYGEPPLSTALKDERRRLADQSDAIAWDPQ